MRTATLAASATAPSLGRLGAVLLCAVPAAWLLPNHYYPWVSAWQDGLAMGLLGLGALALGGRNRWPRSWALLLLLAAASVAGQWAGGLIRFGGDAWMAGLYMLAFALALAAGGALMDGDEHTQQRRIHGLALGLVLAAVASVGIALAQWTQSSALGLYGIELRPGGRPFGNLAQPNHLCTAAFMGLGATLALYEAGRIGRVGLAAGAAFLLLGMVASGSRTGWLQLAMGFFVFLALRKRCRLRLQPAAAVAGLLVFAALTLAWPSLNEASGLSGSRSLAAASHEGLRLPLWLAMADALSQRPWTGYGWQQMVHAQWAVALDHAAIQRHFEHSHNLVVDLLVWAGLPLGGLLVGLLALALLRPLAAWRDAQTLGLYIGVLGLFVHGLLEYPHTYAYFLIPAGLVIGVVHARNEGGGDPAAGWRWSRVLAPAFALALAVTAVDYLEAETNHRTLRLESARIGVSRIESPAPQLRVLTQLEAFLGFARLEARAGMSAHELQWFRDVAKRYAYPPSMLRLAVAEGLNGQAQAAAETLKRICAMHPPARCDEARAAWVAAQQRWPQLAAVPAP